MEGQGESETGLEEGELLTKYLEGDWRREGVAVLVSRGEELTPASGRWGLVEGQLLT